eukprot:Nk52_evm12s230 gene=Nk52_evmTU12s230
MSRPPLSSRIREICEFAKEAFASAAHPTAHAQQSASSSGGAANSVVAGLEKVLQGRRPVLNSAVVAEAKGLSRPQQIQKLEEMLTLVSLEDFGVKKPIVHPEWQTPVMYAPVCYHRDFHIGIFFVRRGCRMPLHDHPHMTVLSKLLYGRVKMRSFDVADLSHTKLCERRQPSDEGSTDWAGWLKGLYKGSMRYVSGAAGDSSKATGKVEDMILGKLFVSETVDAEQRPEPLVLFPTSGGNIHSFCAVEDTAFLDILTPPYSTAEGRPCTYYEEVPLENLSEREMDVFRNVCSCVRNRSDDSSGLHLLRAIEAPDDFDVTNVYLNHPVTV